MSVGKDTLQSLLYNQNFKTLLINIAFFGYL